jgi:preprotein translocase subunit SecF
VINTFAFVLLVGIIVGTYSSVFVASPVALSVSRVIIKRRAARSRR